MKTDYQTINQSKLIRILKEKGLVHLIKRIKYRVIDQLLIYIFGKQNFLLNGE